MMNAASILPSARSLTGLSALAIAALLQIAGPAAAQSMLGAPGLSPVAPSEPGAPGAAVQPPAAMVQPPAAASPATSCETDMAKFQQRRQPEIEALNKIVAAGKGKVDPVASCPKLRALVAVETQMRNWMIKQKEWCNIPDQVIDQMKEGTGKTAQIAERACQAAAQMKRQQQMPAGGAGGAPAMKLPTGPL